MRVAFDENLPAVMVRLFQDPTKAISLGCEIVSAVSYRPQGEIGDDNWVRRFASSGGRVVISGDTRMRALPHERAALAETGVITYFFERSYSRLGLHEKCAILIKRWPQICEHMKLAEHGTCWEIRDKDKEFRNVSRRAENIGLSPNPKKKARKRREKDGARPGSGGDQITLDATLDAQKTTS